MVYFLHNKQMTQARVISSSSDYSFITGPREGTQTDSKQGDVLSLSAMRMDVEDRLRTSKQKKVMMHLSGMNSRPDSIDLRGESTNETLLEGTKRNQIPIANYPIYSNRQSGMIDESNPMLGLIEACQAQKLMLR